MNFVKNLILVFLISVSAWSQPSKVVVKHKVKAGENVTQIAKKYQVTPFDIYKLNPDAKNGVSVDQILLIEVNNSKINEFKNPNTNSDNKITYEVLPKDTKFGIAKKFNITVNDIDAWNADVAENGLKSGQVIFIKKHVSSNNSYKNVVVNDTILNSDYYYTIQPEDTKFSVAKKFGISIEKLEQLNPNVSNSFPVGLSIVIKNKSTSSNTNTESINKQYTILSEETLYGISKKFNVSQLEILQLNPILKEGFKEGISIKIPNNSLVKNIQNFNKNSLIIKKNEAEKKLVMLLPFNIAAIENDTIKTTSDFLKSKEGKLTNIALDYYAGALIAIDSARKIGYPNLKVKIIDFESRKNSNNLQEIIQKNNFSNVDVVIGPFTNAQVEQTAQELVKFNVPIISPLSSTNGKPYSNIYYARPTDELMREVLFEHFKKNNGNVVAIFSPKKITSKELAKAQFPDLKVIPLSDKGGVTIESITPMLQQNKKNYVILDTEKVGLILNVTNVLANLKSKFDIQLVVFELNSALDFEEISLKRYTDLKLMFPSITKSNKSGYYESFRQKFKKDNNVNPNEFATRGFDVTFDTIIRMYQEEGFANSTENQSSEQLVSKFNYEKIEQGNYNKGVYLLQYMNDLTIEEVK